MKTTGRPLVIGTRGSELALWQAHWVRDRLLEFHSGLTIELKVIKTKGDKILDAALSKIGDKGLFTREIEHELLAGTIDLAVHSLKDLPTTLPEGLALGAIPQRESPADAVVSKGGVTLAEMAAGAMVLTGSLRRRAQLLHLRPDLTVGEVRGNVQSRLSKLDEGSAQAIILAEAGLNRLGLQARITERLDPRQFIPATSQGALGVEIRREDERTRQLLAPLHHEPTAACCLAERALLHGVEGGCQIPVGAYATWEGGQVRLTAMIAALDGAALYRSEVVGPAGAGERLGQQAADDLLNQGGRDILRQLRYNLGKK